MIIDKPGFYKTRSGDKVRVICTDDFGKYPVIFLDGFGSRPLQACSNGNYEESGDPRPYDIVDVWVEPKPKMKIWNYDGCFYIGEKQPAISAVEFKITRDMIEE